MAVISQLKIKSKNLLNLEYVKNPNNWVINPTSSTTSYYYLDDILEVGKTYTISYGYSEGFEYFYLNKTTDDWATSSTIYLTTKTGTDQNNPYTFTVSKGERYRFFKYPNSQEQFDLLNWIQLEKGSTATEYEPYYLDITKYNNSTIRNITSNGESISNLPAGDYHFAKNTFVDGKNLLNLAEFSKFGSWRTDIATSGGMITGGTNKGFLLNVEAGKTYTISYEIKSMDDIPKYLYLGKAVNGEGTRIAYLTTSEVQNNPYTFTTEADTVYFLRMGYTGYEKDLVDQIARFVYLQLEEGSAATEYKPYNGTKSERICDDAVNEPIIDMKISGNSVQNIVEGKNLFNVNNLKPFNSNVTLSILDNTITLTNNNSYSVDVFRDEQIILYAGTYTISIKEPIYKAISVYTSEPWAWFANGIIAGNTSATFTLTEEKKIQLSCSIPSNTSITISNVMIEKGNKATEYEPYVGNVSVPTPETPINIESCGEKTSNIFSSYGVSATLPTSPSANRVLTNAYGTTINSIDFTGEIIATQTQYPNPSSFVDYRNGFFSIGVNGLEVGKKYTLIYDYEVLENPLNNETTNTIMLNGGFGTYAEQSGNRLKYVFSWKKPEGYETREYIEIRLGGRSMKFKNFMILDGEVDGFPEYEPYDKYKIPINISGKNLFDYTTLLNAGKIEMIDEKTGEFSWKGTTGIPSTYIKAKENTQYFVSFKAKTMIEQTAIIVFYYTDGTYKGIEAVSSPDGFVTVSGLSQANKTVDYVKFGGSGGLATGSIFKELQIEENNEATPYEPYFNKTTNIYLNEPLRKVGNYADYIDYKNKKVVRNLSSYIFTGTENPVLKYSDEEKYNYETQTKASASIISTIPMCTHLKGVSGNVASTNIPLNHIRWSGYSGAYNLVVSQPTTDELKSWLAGLYNAGTPMIIYYVLKTPIEETIEIPEILTQDGTNIFEIQTTLEPTELKINYWKQI